MSLEHVHVGKHSDFPPLNDVKDLEEYLPQKAGREGASDADSVCLSPSPRGGAYLRAC